MERSRIAVENLYKKAVLVELAIDGLSVGGGDDIVLVALAELAHEVKVGLAELAR